MGRLAFCRYSQNSAGRQRPDQGGQGFVCGNARVFTIIQARPPQLLVIQVKSQRFDKMQVRSGVGAQTHDIACVWRYLGFEQCDMEHGYLSMGNWYYRCHL